MSLTNLIYKFNNTTSKGRYFLFATALVVMWFLSGMLFDSANTNKMDDKDFSINLSTEEISPQLKVISLKLNGIVDVENNVTVIPEVAGKVKSVNVERGDFVKKNQIILSIEVNDKQIKLEKAVASLEQKNWSMNQLNP